MCLWCFPTSAWPEYLTSLSIFFGLGYSLCSARWDIRLSLCHAVWGRDWGSICPSEEDLASQQTHAEATGIWHCPSCQNPPPGTSRGQPARNLGRGSRNSWSQHCTNGQEARRGPRSLGSLPGEVARTLGGTHLPCLKGHKGQCSTRPCLHLHPL